MANIPVERNDRGGIPWWAWLLGALLLLALLLALTQCGDDETTVVDDEAGVIDDGIDDPAFTGDDPSFAGDTAGITDPTPAVATGALTSIEQVREARRSRGLFGREVELSGVRATTVSGDSTFMIDDPDGAEGRMLVVLEDLGEGESTGTGEGDDGVYNVDDGDVVNVFGRVDRFTGRERQVAGSNASRLLPDSLFIRARRLTSSTDDVRN